MVGIQLERESSFFFRALLRVVTISLIVILYLAGLVFIPLYFDGLLQNDTYASMFYVPYFLFGAFIFYYLNGIKRKKTKNIKLIVCQDLGDFKNGVKKFIQGIGVLSKGLLILAAWLLAIGAIILVFILFGWLIFSLSATTIIILLLVLILLK